MYPLEEGVIALSNFLFWVAATPMDAPAVPPMTAPMTAPTGAPTPPANAPTAAPPTAPATIPPPAAAKGTSWRGLEYATSSEQAKLTILAAFFFAELFFR
jgi:hypothetical protein